MPGAVTAGRGICFGPLGCLMHNSQLHARVAQPRGSSSSCSHQNSSKISFQAESGNREIRTGLIQRLMQGQVNNSSGQNQGYLLSNARRSWLMGTR